MTMALVGTGIPCKKIHVSFALNIPEVNALTSLGDYGLWAVIFADVLSVLFHIELGTRELPYTIWGLF
jgi:hypothetical protein